MNEGAPPTQIAVYILAYLPPPEEVQNLCIIYRCAEGLQPLFRPRRCTASIANDYRWSRLSESCPVDTYDRSSPILGRLEIILSSTLTATPMLFDAMEPVEQLTSCFI